MDLGDGNLAIRPAGLLWLMKTTIERALVPEKVASLDELAIASPESGKGLNVALVYQDTETRKWAREVYERFVDLAAKEAVRPTWWKLSNLSEPGVLAGAVSMAMRADVIVVCVRAAEGLPLPFYVWVDAWVPYRLQATGALVALLGTSRNQRVPSKRVREHLRAVARESHLEFLIEQRHLPLEPIDLSREQFVTEADRYLVASESNFRSPSAFRAFELGRAAVRRS